MTLYRKPCAIGLLFVALLLFCSAASSQEVLHVPSEHQSLAQRLVWAGSLVKTDPSFANGYWIGYAVEKYMH